MTAWAGFRGAVSLAAALAVPAKTLSGAPFPDRSMIIFVVVVVILITVLVQGISLPAVVRWAKMPQDATYCEELQLARSVGAQSRPGRVADGRRGIGRQPKMLAASQKEYDEHAALVMEGDDESTDDLAKRDDLVRRIRLGVLDHKRRAITVLRNQTGHRRHRAARAAGRDGPRGSATSRPCRQRLTLCVECASWAGPLGVSPP